MTRKFKSPAKSARNRRNYDNQAYFLLKKVGVLNLSLMAGLISLIFIYLAQTTHSTTKGFEISNLQAQLAAHEEETRQLEQQANSLKSVEYIAREARNLEMVAAVDVEFLAPLATAGVAYNQ